MRLNGIRPARGSRPGSKRLGRGGGSGLGKTSGRGHKGQRARAGGYHKVGFEGGQMPLQRRLPKVGFLPPTHGDTAEVRLGELQRVKDPVISLETLKSANVVPASAKKVKIFLSGEIKKAVTISGVAVAVTRGAREAILAAGGKVEAHG